MSGDMEHFDDKGHGAMLSQVSWRIVMTMVMEYCDDKGHGALS